MRLLYVIDSLAPGGAETSLAEMAPYLAAEGVELHVLPLGPPLDLAERIEGGGGIVHRRRAPGGRVGNVRAVLDSIGSVRPDIVHTTLYEAGVAGRTAARLRGIPVSTSLVNDAYGAAHRAEYPPVRLALARALDVATSRVASRFHSVSGAVADAVAPRLGIRRDLVEVIPRGRDPRRFPYRPEGVRARVRAGLGLDEQVPVVLAVGRLDPQKGMHHLLAAAPVVRRSVPGVVVLVAGKDGRSSARLREQAQDVDGDVRFLGHRTDVPDLMAAADTFCFPSEREGFGGVLVEALAVGCPIVASDIPTTLEVLGPRHGDVAATTPVGDVDRLSLALVDTLTSPDGAEARARRGRARFEEHFAIEPVTREMTRFFGRVVGG